MPHVSHSVSGALRTFSFWVANGTVGLPLLEGVDYFCIFSEPSALEQTYAIFINVLEFDEAGVVTNAKHAEHRATQPILQYVTGQRSSHPLQRGRLRCIDAARPNHALQRTVAALGSFLNSALYFAASAAELGGVRPLLFAHCSYSSDHR